MADESKKPMDDQPNTGRQDNAKGAQGTPAPKPASGALPEPKPAAPQPVTEASGSHRAAEPGAGAGAPKGDAPSPAERKRRAKAEAKAEKKAQKLRQKREKARGRTRGNEPNEASAAGSAAEPAKKPAQRQPQATDPASAPAKPSGPQPGTAQPGTDRPQASTPEGDGPGAAGTPANPVPKPADASDAAPAQPGGPGRTTEHAHKPASTDAASASERPATAKDAGSAAVSGAAAGGAAGAQAASGAAAQQKPTASDTRGESAGTTGAQPGTPAPQAMAAGAAATDLDSKAAKRRRKREKAQAAAARDSRHSGRRKAGAVAGSTLVVLLAGGAVAAGSLFAPQAEPGKLPSAVTSLPAGDSVYTCPQVPQLLKGVDGTDPQFAPGAKDVSTTIRSAVVSDLAKRIPGSGLGELGQDESRQLTKRIPDEQAREARGSDDQGLTGRTAQVSNTANLDPLQVLRIQPLGDLPSIGSGLRSYQAKDGDLAGLAAGNCVAAASNWRFTGLQTTTGSSSVLHLANPTSTTAQVSIELRGPQGLVDTSTLQEIVLAPGASRAIVLGGYAQGQESVSANIRSLGGKITASIQQSALRGLTPSGVDFVAASAPAANTQVIPGVWIDEKSNIDELTADAAAKNLVPQLHVSATGAAGAGFSVKVLDERGEVAAKFDDHLAVASNATSIVDLRQLDSGYYTVVVEADDPVTAAVRMVRGKNPKDSSDTAWASSSQPLVGNQVTPLAAHGNATFTIAAPQGEATVNAVVISKDGSMAEGQELKVPAGTSRTFKPTDVSEDAQAVLFQADADAYIAQTLLGSDRSVSWAKMPPASVGSEGIVVNVGG